MENWKCLLFCKSIVYIRSVNCAVDHKYTSVNFGICRVDIYAEVINCLC